MNEGFVVDRRRLLLRQPLTQEKGVGVDDAGEGSLADECLGDGRRHVRQGAELLLRHRVEIHDALADLPVKRRTQDNGDGKSGKYVDQSADSHVTLQIEVAGVRSRSASTGWRKQ